MHAPTHLPRRHAAEGPGQLVGGGVRSLALYALAALALALPLAAAMASFRVSPADLPAALEAALDQRSEGERAVAYAQRRLGLAPDDPRALASLASAYLLRVRETGDPVYYGKADELLSRALTRPLVDAEVVLAAGSLAASRHDFVAALEWGRRAAALAPAGPAGYGVLVDALVELGRYDEAVAGAQRMVDLRPDLASLSRVSYLRELHGDLAGAIDAMRRAVDAGAPRSEATVWSEVQLGHLHFAAGDLAAARRAYESALRRIPDHPAAIAALARLRAAKGDLAGAIRLHERAAARLPIPDFVVALGDAYAALGQAERAERQYELVAAMGRLLAANGVRVDVDLALFNADHRRDIPAALAAARGEYARRGASVHVADALAWAEYRAGDLASAVAHSREALRLGTQDPLLLYRAGVIAQAADEAERGRALLERSYGLNPKFSLLYADDLARRLGR